MVDGMRSTKDLGESNVAGRPGASGQPESGTAEKQRLVLQEKERQQGADAKTQEKKPLQERTAEQTQRDRKNLDNVNERAERDRAEQVREEEKRRDLRMKDIKTTPDDPRHDPMWAGSPDNRAELAQGGEVGKRTPVVVLGRHIGYAAEVKAERRDDQIVRLTYRDFLPTPALSSYIVTQGGGEHDLVVNYDQGWLEVLDIPERNRAVIYRRDLVEVLDEVNRQ